MLRSKPLRHPAPSVLVVPVHQAQGSGLDVLDRLPRPFRGDTRASSVLQYPLTVSARAFANCPRPKRSMSRRRLRRNSARAHHRPHQGLPAPTATNHSTPTETNSLNPQSVGSGYSDVLRHHRAETVGFEPTEGVNPHILSRDAHSTGLCDVSLCTPRLPRSAHSGKVSCLTLRFRHSVFRSCRCA